MKSNDPTYQFLTRVMWRWFFVFATLGVTTAVGECIARVAMRRNWSPLAIAIVSHTTNLALGLSVAFGLLTIVTAHQRAQLRKSN